MIAPNPFLGVNIAKDEPANSAVIKGCLKSRRVPCPQCQGKDATCPVCSGAGFLYQPRWLIVRPNAKMPKRLKPNPGRDN